MQLLGLLGYEINENNDYVYRRTSSEEELLFRQEVADEFDRFSTDLKKIKAGNLLGFKEYISVGFVMDREEIFAFWLSYLEIFEPSTIASRIT